MPQASIQINGLSLSITKYLHVAVNVYCVMGHKQDMDNKQYMGLKQNMGQKQ